MHCANLFLLLSQGAVQRTWKRVLVATGLVLTLGATSSWGQVPATNDTSDSNGNTGGGTGALANLTLSSSNTAYGRDALAADTIGNENTAVGFDALKNTTGGGINTAVGSRALLSNTTGSDNTAVGTDALFNNLTGSDNIAAGVGALIKNTTGTDNTAVGAFALNKNTTGGDNAALGRDALLNNTTGGDNLALGAEALENTTDGTNNIALGRHAGIKLTSGEQNIYLGHRGRVSESNTMRLGQEQTRTFIAGIYNTALSSDSPQPVFINSKGQLGFGPISAARYKRDIHDMRDRSQGLYQLRAVTFRYKQDAQGRQQYGLIAEEVAKVYPELVIRGAKGKIESVQYHELISLLLNELQHQQQTLATQGQELAELKGQTARLQAALVQQTAAFAARLDQLEHAAQGATVAAR